MHDSERYRRNAADCLRAAGNASDLYYKRFNLLIAQAWLGLAIEDDVVGVLLGDAPPQADVEGRPAA
jgi:hypothetical protein